MAINSIPSKIKHYLDLIRFTKPIGFSLLFWPCWFALALLPKNPFEYFKWYCIFFLGSFLMRSVGCIVNDLIDINLDKKVKRTSNRPLANGSIKKIEAIILLILLSSFSFIILILFNFKAIIVGLLSIPLIILYPFMKRFTYWPQLFLGIVFNWGVLITAIQFYEKISINFILLYIGCIFWTLAYDTIYAYQDRKDDIKNNIKSTAVLFGNLGKKYVLSFYIIFFIIIGYIGFLNSGSVASIILIFLFIITMIFFLNKWNINSRNSSNNYFRFNNFIGLGCFIYLVLF